MDSGDIADGIQGATNISLAELPFKACDQFALPDDVKVGDKVPDLLTQQPWLRAYDDRTPWCQRPPVKEP